MKTKTTLNQFVSLKKIILYEREELKIVDQNLIIRVESNRCYSLIYFVDGTSHLASKPLKEIEVDLDKTLFLRIHRSHLINIGSVCSILRGGKSRIKLTDGTILPITSEKLHILIESIKRFGDR
jgi:two-component system LytT family response regulator